MYSSLNHVKKKLNKIILLLSSLFVFFTPSFGFSQQIGTRLSINEIKSLLIEYSITNYPGNCPCPYNYDKAGNSCGGRSAWSRPGGYRPLCYSSDISASMVIQFRSHTGY